MKPRFKLQFFSTQEQPQTAGWEKLDVGVVPPEKFIIESRLVFCVFLGPLVLKDDPYL